MCYRDMLISTNGLTFGVRLRVKVEGYKGGRDAYKQMLAKRLKGANILNETGYRFHDGADDKYLFICAGKHVNVDPQAEIYREKKLRPTYRGLNIPRLIKQILAENEAKKPKLKKKRFPVKPLKDGQSL